MSIDIGIEDFGTEGGDGVAVGGAVRVSDVLERSIPIHWDEAVALVQELVDTVTSANRDDIPGFEDVLIDASGVVTVTMSHRGDRGPVAAGRALHELLSTADVPVALRLFVTQANVPDTHASLQAFANGLAYFGKSGRTELISSIYSRYRSAAGDAPTAVVPRRKPMPPPVPVEPKEAFVPPVRKKRALPRWAVAAVAAMVVIGALAMVWQTIGGATGQSPLSAAKSAARAAADFLTLPTPATQTASTTPEAPLPSPQPSTSAPAKPQAATPQQRLDAAARKLPKSRESGDVPAIVAYETLRAPVMPSGFDPSASTDAEAKAALAKAIYTREDADVQPPVMLYPQMPPPLVVGALSEGIVNRMELVIATDGTVERVRLVSTPRRMADMMLLSGAKLWRFSPAVKDGEAVRYRTTLSWTVFP